MNKLLCDIAILSVAAFGNVEVNAGTSLRNLFNDSTKTVDFNSNCKVYYYDTPKEGEPTPITLDQSQYIYDISTFYINTNTIPLLSNTGGGGSKGKYKR